MCEWGAGASASRNLNFRKDRNLPLHARYLNGSGLCHPQICHFGVKLFRAKDNWEETDTRKVLCPSPICLKARQKFVNVSPSPLYWKGEMLITEDNCRSLSAWRWPPKRDHHHKQYRLLSPISFPPVFAFAQFAALEIHSPLPLSCQFPESFFLFSFFVLVKMLYKPKFWSPLWVTHH